MNYQKIGKICGASKHLQVVSVGDRQYVGDGTALYSLYGMPLMSPTQLISMWDLDPSKVTVTESDGIKAELGDTSYSETLIEHEGLNCDICGTPATVFYTERGAVCISRKYLAPFTGSDMGEISFYLRNNAIAVKQGFFFAALILPLSLKNSNVCDTYRELLGQLETAKRIEIMEKAQQPESEDEDV